ncbi:hypothetical protein CEK26_000770 [Fusarium fujikuroi]|uniref:Uncharacterized protein n=1 Tax=Fusarium fujikuroi TaxID=5127 RepID=A0A5Q3EC23_FUSFU|nr:hypothetical protein CEK27_000771 [Fusarium fujikuroi]QGI75865.1 hypothetical protein CEK25_000771 [Fusarium fujikuroi]QGI89555.1 hypothetical protein CEK26_000770 [Fusarium fujikuroi]VTT63093.1 unnamed protein product [Fusarium fujikuroi]VTT73033.1 unnamed protein product [Fusarium fujikuroi]
MYRYRKSEAHHDSPGHGNSDHPNVLAGPRPFISHQISLPMPWLVSLLGFFRTRLHQSKDLNDRVQVVLTPPMTSGPVNKTTPCFWGHTSLSRSQIQATIGFHMFYCSLDGTGFLSYSSYSSAVFDLLATVCCKTWKRQVQTHDAQTRLWTYWAETLSMCCLMGRGLLRPKQSIDSMHKICPMTDYLRYWCFWSTTEQLEQQSESPRHSTIS